MPMPPLPSHTSHARAVRAFAACAALFLGAQSALAQQPARSGATAAFYRSKGYRYPPEYAPLAAVTPGTVGGMLVMLAEYGRLSLKDVLAPAIARDSSNRERAESSRISGALEFVSNDATARDSSFDQDFYAGTTSIEAADEEGWVVSVTPSGGWVPAVIAGHTGIGLSERAQSFVTDPADGPYNVIEPGKRPRVTLTPTIALRNGAPYLAFAVQGGDTQDQNLLQFFLNVVDFGMTVQQACEAPNINSFQMHSSFGQHESRPGRMLVATSLPDSTREALRRMGYTLVFAERTSGPINAILFDTAHHTMWNGSSNHGEDYGIAW